MEIKSIKRLKKITGKTVLLRADFNVPIECGEIKDDFKIIAGLPTLRYLLRNRCKIIIITHLGNPLRYKGDRSVKPIVVRLEQLLGRKVNYIVDLVCRTVIEAVKKMNYGDILLLENLRLKTGEEKNSPNFAKSLAKLADIYINDAFAVSHRNHASVSAIKKYLPAYAGLLLEKEIINLNKILKPVKPLITIVGGAKMETKTALIKNLSKKSYRILIGGAIANNFIAAHGFNVGQSLIDKNSINIANKLKNKNIILPVDVVVSDNFKGTRAWAKNVNNVDKDEIILDIGPRTIKLFTSFIKKANTIIWNGPLGYFENEHFKHGTLSVGRVIASRSTGPAFGIVGGGETIEALKMTKMIDYIDWVSTGGGAMLSYLGGEKMPGLKGLVY